MESTATRARRGVSRGQSCVPSFSWSFNAVCFCWGQLFVTRLCWCIDIPNQSQLHDPRPRAIESIRHLDARQEWAHYLAVAAGDRQLLFFSGGDLVQRVSMPSTVTAVCVTWLLFVPRYCFCFLTVTQPPAVQMCSGHFLSDEALEYLVSERGGDSAMAGSAVEDQRGEPGSQLVAAGEDGFVYLVDHFFRVTPWFRVEHEITCIKSIRQVGRQPALLCAGRWSGWNVYCGGQLEHAHQASDWVHSVEVSFDCFFLVVWNYLSLILSISLYF